MKYADLIFGYIWLGFSIMYFIGGDCSEGVIRLLLAVLFFRLYYLTK